MYSETQIDGCCFLDLNSVSGPYFEVQVVVNS